MARDEKSPVSRQKGLNKKICDSKKNKLFANIFNISLPDLLHISTHEALTIHTITDNINMQVIDINNLKLYFFYEIITVITIIHLVKEYSVLQIQLFLCL